ncbi:MAG: AEC family transporter [Alphaproteobacteria bacterium]
MSETVLALAPVGLVIALGWALKRGNFPGDAFWGPAERITYYILMPSLIVGNLAGAPLATFHIAPIIVTLVAALLVGAGVMLALRRALTPDGPAFTSLFRGAILSNIYAAMAAAVALHGDAGLTLAAVAVAAYVPTVNVLSVTILGRYAGAEPAHWRRVAGTVARNPMIIACAVGAGLNGTGLGVPPTVDALFEILGRTALAIGLLCVGAGLSFSGLGPARRGIAATCTVKLALLPVLAAPAAGCSAWAAPAPRWSSCSPAPRPPPAPSSWPARWAATPPSWPRSSPPAPWPPP